MAYGDSKSKMKKEKTTKKGNARKGKMAGSRLAFDDTKQEKRKITDAQKKKLAEHSKHHTAKHMAMMRKLMREGKSFSVAHRETQKKLGK